MEKSQEIQGLMQSEGGQTAAVCSVLTFKDLEKIVFHKLIKEAKLTMQTKAGWKVRTTHFNVLVPHLLPQKI